MLEYAVFCTGCAVTVYKQCTYMLSMDDIGDYPSDLDMEDVDMEELDDFFTVRLQRVNVHMVGQPRNNDTLAFVEELTLSSDDYTIQELVTQINIQNHMNIQHIHLKHYNGVDVDVSKYDVTRIKVNATQIQDDLYFGFFTDTLFIYIPDEILEQHKRGMTLRSHSRRAQALRY